MSKNRFVLIFVIVASLMILFLCVNLTTPEAQKDTDI